MVRETEKKLIKLRFEEDRSESGRKNGLCSGLWWPGAGEVLETDKNASRWLAESGGGGMKKLTGRDAVPLSHPSYWWFRLSLRPERCSLSQIADLVGEVWPEFPATFTPSAQPHCPRYKLHTLSAEASRGQTLRGLVECGKNPVFILRVMRSKKMGGWIHTGSDPSGCLRTSEKHHRFREVHCE